MKSVLVIGLGRFGRHACKKFIEQGCEVMAVDRKEKNVNEVLSLVTQAQIGDVTDEKFLGSLGVADYDLCLVTIGDDFQSSLEATSLLKELGAKKIVARAARTVHEKFLLRNGADEVVYPERQLANWAAIRYSSEKLVDYMEIDGDFAVFGVQTPEAWIGKSVIDLNVRKAYGINIMAYKRGDKFSMLTEPETIFEGGDVLFVVGEISKVKKCFKL